MPKSIHERVRATLEKQEREKRGAESRANDSAFRRACRADEEYERGAEWAHEGNLTPPPRASADFIKGFRAGWDAETREMLGDY
jgi:hypothetical protein